MFSHLKAFEGPVYRQVGSLSRGPVKIARLYKRYLSDRITLLPGTELRSVSFNKNFNKRRKHFSRNNHGAGMFPQCSHTAGNIVSSVSFCFQDANYAYATRQRILTKIRACEQLQKFCEHEQASTHLIFASNSSKGQILRALSNWMGPFVTPHRLNLLLVRSSNIADKNITETGCPT